MTITIFGASGKVGRLVVEQLLQNGHKVTIFVHSNSPFDASDQVRVVKGDVHDSTAVSEAVRGSDAVISTLGSWHTPTKDILSAAMKSVIPAMENEGSTRIITLTGSGAWAPDEHISFGNRVQHGVFTLVAGKIIQDSEEHLRLLAKSGLDWTCVRAPVMKAGPATEYTLTTDLPKPWEIIPRATVAKAIVDLVADDHFSQRAPHLHAK